MADKTPAEKMRLEAGMAAAFVDVPTDVVDLLGVPEGVERGADVGAADYVFTSARTREEAEERLSSIAPLVAAKARVWIAYPKGAKAAGFDVSRDTIMTFAPSVGLMANANIAISEYWSSVGLRRA